MAFCPANCGFCTQARPGGYRIETGIIAGYGILAIFVSERLTFFSMNHAPETNNQDKPEGLGIIHGHEYVDLGLSVKWATCNVGAESPLDFGLYFAWGETKPKTEYTLKSYKFYESGETYKDVKFNNYNLQREQGEAVVKTRLDLCDDAARANWGGMWRMPTIQELEELNEKCDWRFFRTEDRLEYYKVTSKINGAMIMIPLAGLRDERGFRGQIGFLWSASLIKSNPLPGQEGFIGENIWSSSFQPGDPRYAICLNYGYSDLMDCDMIGWYSSFRSEGFPVRAVTE